MYFYAKKFAGAKVEPKKAWAFFFAVFLRRLCRFLGGLKKKKFI